MACLSLIRDELAFRTGPLCHPTLSVLAGFKCGEHPLWGDWQFHNAHADRIRDGIGDGAGYRKDRALACTLGAERPRAVALLLRDGDELGGQVLANGTR